MWWEEEENLVEVVRPDCYGDKDEEQCDRCILLNRIAKTLVKLRDDGAPRIEGKRFLRYWVTRFAARYGFGEAVAAVLAVAALTGGEGVVDPAMLN